MHQLQGQPNPFEAIRRTDHRGEYWTGRELQPVMTYARWRDFAAVIEKAKTALALVAGQAAADEAFQQVGSVVHVRNLGEQQRLDYRLTRFGAYLTAMAGDDTKMAIAAARIYFAVKTREAEATLPEQHLVEPKLDPDLARIYELTLGMQETREQQRALEAEQRRMADELHGVAEDVADLKALSPIASDALLTLRDAARAVTGNQMGQNRFKRWLLDEGIMFADHQGHARLYQGWVDGGLGIERWEQWPNGRGWAWVPYFTAIGVARLRRTYLAGEDGAVAA